MKLPAPKYTVTANKRHQYTIALPNGETVGPLKSVTGVLDIINKPQLKSWAARMAADYFKAEILRQGVMALNPVSLDLIANEAKNAHAKFAKDAADLGTECHAAFDAIIKGQELPEYPEALKEPITAFKTYRLQSDIEVVATELKVASLKHRSGGCLDFLGYSKSRGGWGIGDYKTSTGFYGNEYAYQAGGGYALMVEEMYGVDIAWSEIVRFGKKPPYDSEARPVTDVRAAMRGFLNALALVRSNEENLIGAPTFTSTPEPAPAEFKGPAIPAAARPDGF